MVGVIVLNGRFGEAGDGGEGGAGDGFFIVVVGVGGRIMRRVTALVFGKGLVV